MNLHSDFPYPLYLVLSEKSCLHHPWLEVAEQAIQGGVDIIQLREKEFTTDEFLFRAEQLKTLTDRYQIPLVINDNVAVATAIQSWGMHVGQTDTPPSVLKKQQDAPPYIGWSLENLQQLESEEMKAVHHLGISPIFSTKTKTDTLLEWGIEGIRQIRSLTAKPLIAIGSVNASNARAIVQAGANSIAVVSAICANKDPYQAALTLKEMIHETTL